MLVELTQFEQIEINAAVLCPLDEVIGVERMVLGKHPRQGHDFKGRKPYLIARIARIHNFLLYAPSEGRSNPSCGPHVVRACVAICPGCLLHD